MGAKGGRVFRDNYNDTWTKLRGWGQGMELGMAGVGGVVEGNADNCT